MRLEVRAGIVAVELQRDAAGTPSSGTIDVPQPLSLGAEIPVETVAACLGLAPGGVGVVNAVYGEAFAGPRPARTTMAVAALPPGVRFQIDMTALHGEVAAGSRA